MPLAEASVMVVHRQVAAGFNPSTVERMAYLEAYCKVGRKAVDGRAEVLV